MKNKKVLIGIVIFLVVALIVFFVLGMLRKGPGPREAARMNTTAVYEIM